MQSISQNRSIQRLVLLALAVLSLVIASWWAASGRNQPALLTPDRFSAEAASRTGLSTDQQIQSLQQQLRISPNDWQSYSQLGLAYLQKARETGDPTYYGKAEEALDAALAAQPEDYASLSGKGTLALARHEFAAALEWGEQARQINPDRTYAYGVIADAQVELGRYQEAIETLQAMVDLRPDMSSYSRISYVRELHGDTDGALEMMQLAVDSGTPHAENTAWVRTQLGNLYFNAGELDRAALEYERTLQSRPGYVYALAGLGRVHAAKGEREQAIWLLSQAVAAMPLPEFVITLGDLYQAAGQVEEATQQYELLAAIEQVHRASGVDMDMEIALFHADRNWNLEETVRLARQAYTSRPGIHAADVLAWALYKAGHYQEAQKYSEEALKLGTKDALKLFHAGMIAGALQNDQQAVHYLEQALAINPHFSILYADQARTTLQLLQRGASMNDREEIP